MFFKQLLEKFAWQKRAENVELFIVLPQFGELKKIGQVEVQGGKMLFHVEKSQYEEDYLLQ